MRRLTQDQARRYALGAQGFHTPRPQGRIDVRHFRQVVDRIQVVQLDSVNVFARTHYLPFFSRLGAYDQGRLDDWIWSSGEMFEYWCHMASVAPVSHYPLFKWRMDRELGWAAFQSLQKERPEYVEAVLEEVAARGPIQTSDLPDPGSKPGGGMWGWNDGKIALEALFSAGRVTTAARPNFTRLYDLPERVIPAQHLNAPTPPDEEAQAELLKMGAKALGVGTAEDIADYYRIRMPVARPLIDKLAESGELIAVDVAGWTKPGYLHPEATLPRTAAATTLLSPFDNLVFFRDRVERIWDFYYRIEIYVPEPKRIYGYYVLPFLFEGHLSARVDLKADRKAGALLVRGAYSEPDTDRTAVGRALASELVLVAQWLGLDEVVVGERGDLAVVVAAELSR